MKRSFESMGLHGPQGAKGLVGLHLQVSWERPLFHDLNRQPGCISTRGVQVFLRYPRFLGTCARSILHSGQFSRVRVSGPTFGPVLPVYFLALAGHWPDRRLSGQKVKPFVPLDSAKRLPRTWKLQPWEICPEVSPRFQPQTLTAIGLDL